MASASTNSNDDGPVAVVRRIIARRLGTVVVNEKSQVFHCTKDAHNLLCAGSSFVLSKPEVTNRPWLWEDVLTRLTDGMPLLYSKAAEGVDSVHTWILPRRQVEQMAINLATPTNIDSTRDTDMVLKDDQWYWRPAGRDRHKMKLIVTRFHQEWRLDHEEARELRDAFAP